MIIMNNKSTNKNIDIKKFIQCVIEKNYSHADKYLQSAVENKLCNHMKKVKTNNIFKQ